MGHFFWVWFTAPQSGLALLKLAVTKPRYGNPLKGIGIGCDWGTGDADRAQYAGINAKIDADKSGDWNYRGTNGVWRDS